VTASETFDRLESCFACRADRLVTVGDFRYLKDQAGFVPDEWLGWCRQPATLVRCSACGSQGPLRRPSPGLLAQWYRRQSYAAADLLSEGHRRAAALLGPLGPGTLVDVGCGAGTFLDLLSPQITSYGLEPSEESVRYGRDRGRHILIPDSSGWSPDLPDTVDVITLFDVIEHLPFPKAFLTNLFRRLRPGGRLAIFTGNAGSAWAREWNLRWWYHGWAGHLSCFTGEGLRMLLTESTFELESFNALPYMEIGQSWRTLLRSELLRVASRVGVLDVVDAARPPTAWVPLGLDHMLVIARRPR
jgi:SAM-dependent methyltransferase